MVGLELEDFLELADGILEFSPAQEGASELEADGVLSRVGALGLGEGLDGVGVLVLAELGAAEHIGGRAAAGFIPQDLAGVTFGLDGLVGPEIGVGEVEVDVRVGGVEDQGALKSVDGLRGVAAVQQGSTRRHSIGKRCVGVVPPTLGSGPPPGGGGHEGDQQDDRKDGEDSRGTATRRGLAHRMGGL